MLLGSFDNLEFNNKVYLTVVNDLLFLNNQLAVKTFTPSFINQ